MIATHGDARFWDESGEMGWNKVDHYKEMTLEKYGHWARDMIDSVIASMAIGFVGDKKSAFGVVSARRVFDWNAGVVALT